MGGGWPSVDSKDGTYAEASGTLGMDGSFTMSPLGKPVYRGTAGKFLPESFQRPSLDICSCPCQANRSELVLKVSEIDLNSTAGT